MTFIYEGHLMKFTFTDDQDYLAKYINKNKTFFEQSFLRYLRDHKIITRDSVVIDIGACIGNHTVYFSKIIGARKIISIEPTLRSFEVLQRNIELNDINNVICKHVAISSSKGLAQCYPRKLGHIGSNRWVPIGPNVEPLIGPGGQTYNVDAIKNNETVETVLLADIVNEKIDFIKMDVEDAENIIIESGSDVIREYKPILMVEVSKYNLKKFEYLMKDLNYVPIGESVFTKNRFKKANTLLYKCGRNQ